MVKFGAVSIEIKLYLKEFLLVYIHLGNLGINDIIFVLILFCSNNIFSTRIIGPTSNFPEFQKAFNCKANQANNPDKKCSVW